jgi:hypothetical protein
MNSPKVGVHVMCKAYQIEWFKAENAFKVGQNFISNY